MSLSLHFGDFAHGLLYFLKVEVVGIRSGLKESRSRRRAIDDANQRSATRRN